MRAFAAAFALLAAGCQEKLAEPPPNAVINLDAADYVRDPGPKPHLVTYRPSTAGGPEAFRMAILGGVLDFTGPCVRLQDGSGALRVIVTTSGSALKRDSMGWFLPSGRDRLRHGASVQGGGGELPSLPPAAMLANSLPAGCAIGPAVEMVGVRRSPPPPTGN